MTSDNVDVDALVTLLTKAIDGQSVSYDEVVKVQYGAHGELETYANEAWHDLMHWIADQDIFDRDAQYFTAKRERLVWLRDELTSRQSK